MPLLTVSNIVKRFGPDLVLDGITFQVERGEHVGLVGPNGCGKSTLLRIIAGVEPRDEGDVATSRNAIVTYVSQVATFQSTHTLWEAMLEYFSSSLDAQARMRELETRMAEAPDDRSAIDEYRRISSTAEHHAYEHESLIERVLTGLELDESQWSQPVSRLSGGQRTRANLARALIEESDLLLLDEPTNHLDVSAIQWLESYLKAQRRAFIVVAHDRYFLDSVTKRTLELRDRVLEDYPAGYSGFVKLRAERRERQAAEYQRQQQQIATTEEYIRRYGAGQRAREAKGRQKRLERVDRLDRPREERRLKLRTESGKRKGDIALRIERLQAGYAGNPLVTFPQELVVRHGARVAVVGPNGAGKTTLARTLMGQLPPLSGRIVWAPNAVPAYYAQAAEAVFNPDRTVLESFLDRFVVGTDGARSYLARFLFQGEEVEKRAGDLSGGEASRLALACLLFSHPTMLILDEPTNHLDIPAREALEEALSEFAGTLLLISHDRFLVDRLATEVWALEDGRIAVYDGNWADFGAGRNRRTLNYAAVAAAPEGAPPARPSGESRTRRENRRAPRVREYRDLGPVIRQMRELDSLRTPLLTRLQTLGETGSVDQLSGLTDEYARLQARLGDLVTELLPGPR